RSPLPRMPCGPRLGGLGTIGDRQPSGKAQRTHVSFVARAPSPPPAAGSPQELMKPLPSVDAGHTRAPNMSAGFGSWLFGASALGGMLGMASSIFIVLAATTFGSALLYAQSCELLTAARQRSGPCAKG